MDDSLGKSLGTIQSDTVDVNTADTNTVADIKADTVVALEGTAAKVNKAAKDKMATELKDRMAVNN